MPYEVIELIGTIFVIILTVKLYKFYINMANETKRNYHYFSRDRYGNEVKGLKITNESTSASKYAFIAIVLMTICGLIVLIFVIVTLNTNNSSLFIIISIPFVTSLFIGIILYVVYKIINFVKRL